jgi:hypothetical protein
MAPYGLRRISVLWGYRRDGLARLPDIMVRCLASRADLAGRSPARGSVADGLEPVLARKHLEHTFFGWRIYLGNRLFNFHTKLLCSRV